MGKRGRGDPSCDDVLDGVHASARAQLLISLGTAFASKMVMNEDKQSIERNVVSTRKRV